VRCGDLLWNNPIDEDNSGYSDIVAVVKGPTVWHIFKASTHHPLLCHLGLRKTFWTLFDIALSIVAGCDGALIKYIEIINSQYWATNTIIHNERKSSISVPYLHNEIIKRNWLLSLNIFDFILQLDFSYTDHDDINIVSILDLEISPSETDQHEGKFDNTKGVIRSINSKYDMANRKSTKRQIMVS